MLTLSLITLTKKEYHLQMFQDQRLGIKDLGSYSDITHWLKTVF